MCYIFLSIDVNIESENNPNVSLIEGTVKQQTANHTNISNIVTKLEEIVTEEMIEEEMVEEKMVEMEMIEEEMVEEEMVVVETIEEEMVEVEIIEEEMVEEEIVTGENVIEEMVTESAKTSSSVTQTPSKTNAFSSQVKDSHWARPNVFTPFNIQKMGRIPKIPKALADFDTLKMAEMKVYDIPNIIEDLEFGQTSKANLDEYKVCMENIRTDVDAYINTFTTMLLMEEAASSKDAREFEMKKVKLVRDISSGHANNYKINLEVKFFFIHTLASFTLIHFFSLECQTTAGPLKRNLSSF